MNDQAKAEPFSHPENITVGLARIIYGPMNYGWISVHTYHLPGQRTTTDRHEAYAYAVRMNREMGGVEVTTV